MTRKFKLDYTPDFDFLLLGIVSYEKDYRLSWEINEFLQMDLERVDDHKVKHKKSGKDLHFSCFVYTDESAYLNFKLLSNRSEMGPLIEGLKNIDYLLVIIGEYTENLSVDLKKSLLKLESVQSCFILKPENVKNSEIVL
ncbi:MAG: IPExxxVDY family protein [Bacteroidales bacterium]